MAILLLTLLALPAWAHPESISILRFSIEKNVLRATLTLSTRDLDTWFPPTQHPDYLNDLKAGLAKMAGELIEVKLDGTPSNATSTRTYSQKPGSVAVEWVYALPVGASVLQVKSKHLDKLPAGHQQLLYVEDNRVERKPDGDPKIVAEETLTVVQDSNAVELPEK